MNQVLKKYYDIAAAHRAVTDPSVVFRLTTNHPDFPTFATGWFAAVEGTKAKDGRKNATMPALVSNLTTWHFLRSGSFQIVNCGPNDNQIVETIVFDRQKLVLSLYPFSVGGFPSGQLRNPNWRSPISIGDLAATPHGAKGDLLYGSDANGALVSITLMLVSGGIWSG